MPEREEQKTAASREALGNRAPRILLIDSSPQRNREFKASLQGIFHISSVVADSNTHQKFPDYLRSVADKLNHTNFDFLVYNIDSFNVDPSFFREKYPNLSIVVLTEKNAPETEPDGPRHAQLRAQLIRSGADHVQTIPVNPTVLVSHIFAIHKRLIKGNLASEEDTIKFGDISLDHQSRIVQAGGKTVKLSPTEYKILTIFMLNADRTIPSDELVARAWRNHHVIEPFERQNLRTRIVFLRRKLGECGNYIQTQKGLGYLFSNKEN